MRFASTWAHTADFFKPNDSSTHLMTNVVTADLIITSFQTSQSKCSAAGGNVLRRWRYTQADRHSRRCK